MKSLLVLAPVALQAASPYLPDPGNLQASFSYTHDRYGKFNATKTATALPGTLRQNSFLPSFSYGITRNLSADFGTAITNASLPGASVTAPVNSSFGLRYRVYRNDRFTLTLKGGGVFSEFYPIDLASPNGAFTATGFHGALLTGIALPRRAFVLVDTGYLAYNNGVPGRFLGSAFIGQRHGQFTYYAGYQDNRAFSGVDIPNLRATRIRFGEYRRVIGTFDIGGGYTIKRNGLYLGAGYSRWVTSRNAPLSNSLVLTAAFNWKLR